MAQHHGAQEPAALGGTFALVVAVDVVVQRVPEVMLVMQLDNN